MEFPEIISNPHGVEMFIHIALEVEISRARVAVINPSSFKSMWDSMYTLAIVVCWGSIILYNFSEAQYRVLELH